MIEFSPFAEAAQAFAIPLDGQVVVATSVRNSSETLHGYRRCQIEAVRVAQPQRFGEPGFRQRTVAPAESDHTEIGEGTGFAVDSARLVTSRLCQNQRFAEHDLGAGVVSVEHGQSAMPIQRGRQVEGAATRAQQRDAGGKERLGRFQFPLPRQQ